MGGQRVPRWHLVGAVVALTVLRSMAALAAEEPLQRELLLFDDPMVEAALKRPEAPRDAPSSVTANERSVGIEAIISGRDGHSYSGVDLYTYVIIKSASFITCQPRCSASGTSASNASAWPAASHSAAAHRISASA